MYDSIIDKTLLCNENSRRILINHFNRKEEETKTVYIGVDEKKFNPEIYDKKDDATDYTIVGMNKEQCLQLQALHDELYDEYKKIMSGDQNVLFKMKEIWTYMIKLWPDAEKQQKAIRKAKKCSEYENAVRELFLV